MKRFITFFALFSCVFAVAQELTEAQKAALAAANAINNTKVEQKKPAMKEFWKNSIDFDMGLNQTWMTSWAAGGYPSVSLAAGIDGKAVYEKGRAVWNNRMQFNYGLLWSADKIDLIQNSNDRIYLQSQFDYKMTDKSKWRYAAGIDFRTQFAPSLDNYRKDENGKWTGDLKSAFFAPAYFNVAVGVDWKPNDMFDMSIAPLTGDVVIVGRKELRKSYGMPLVAGTEDVYKSSRWSLGTQVKTNLKIKVNDWFNYETQLVVFANYFGKVSEAKVNLYDESGNVVEKDVVAGKTNDIVRLNWDNKISFQVAKYFKIALQTWLIYDPSIIYTKTAKPVSLDEVKCRPVQFKEYFSINFTYNILSKNQRK